MGILLYDSIMLDGAINLENYRNVYSQDVNWRALTNTIELSLGVMIVSVLITFPLAWLAGVLVVACPGCSDPAPGRFAA